MKDIDTENTLPGVPYLGLAIHPYSPNTLYLATEAGMLVTYDGGSKWWNFNSGLPNALVCTDIMVRKDSMNLYMSTIGRGMYRRCIF